jgi:hypothetical protein
MDIHSLYTADAHEEGAEMQITNPATGEKVEAYIKVKGIDSKAFRQASRKKQRAMLTAMSLGEDCDEDKLDVDALAELTIGWRGIMDGDKEYTFTKARAKDLYTQSPGIRDQIDRYISKRANFTKG